MNGDGISAGLETALRLAAGLLLVAANAFFVATEFAMTRLRQLDREAVDDERLDVAWKMTERLEIYLTGCQVGITATSILLGVIAEPAVTLLIRPLAELAGLPGRAIEATSIVLAVLVINLVHTIWGEQSPTYLGVERPAQVARWAAPVLELWTRAVYPLLWVGDRLAKLTLRAIGVEMVRSWTEPGEGDEAGEVGRRELRRQMGEILSRGRLDSERRREVLNALAIDRIRVEEILVPRDEIVALRAGASWAENLATMEERGHTRYPLVGGSPDDFVGVVYVPALLANLDALAAGEVDLAELCSPPLTLEPATSVSEAIDRFQEAGQELALVVEEGRVLGLLTITDALEEIAGEVEDPLD